MIFLQERSIPVTSRALVYGNPNNSKVSPPFHFPITAIYYIIPILTVLFIYLYIKKSRPFNSAKCPSCKKRLRRTKRKQGDYIISLLVLNILQLRRYKCKSCSWQGLRIKYKASKGILQPFLR